MPPYFQKMLDEDRMFSTPLALLAHAVATAPSRASLLGRDNPQFFRQLEEGLAHHEQATSFSKRA